MKSNDSFKQGSASESRFGGKKLLHSFKMFYTEAGIFLWKVLDIRGEIDEPGTKQHILKKINFTGHNAWILIFAVFLASVGLNTNSTSSSLALCWFRP